MLHILEKKRKKIKTSVRTGVTLIQELVLLTASLKFNVIIRTYNYEISTFQEMRNVLFRARIQPRS